MGPLIPNGLIPAEWNFIIALIIGFFFGYVLEASGFSSSRKLAGQFYGYDFAVLKVFFTAAIVSVIGLYYMDYLSWVDITQLYVHPTFLWASIIGGIIMGVGMVYTLGLMLGIFIFSEFYPWIEPFFLKSNLGHITLVDTLGISPYWIIFILAIVAIATFYIADIVRNKVKKVFY